MAKGLTIAFAAPAKPKSGTLVLMAGDGGSLGPLASDVDKACGGAIKKAIKAAAYKGAANAMLDIWAPAKVGLARIVLVGLGKAADLNADVWLKAGGAAMGRLTGGGVDPVTVMLERPSGKEHQVAPENAAQFAVGLKLRHYRFDKYKSKKEGADKEVPASKISIAVAEHAKAKKAFDPVSKVADGTLLARDLVNEPANVLGPVEFAAQAQDLAKLGVDVEVLTEKDMRKLKMNALLGVAQGSVRPPRLVIMRWNGGAKSAAPVAFIGKGVVFDTGGISIKPAGGMEDMKGDMGGAAAVTGLMHALAARKAKVNAIGVIGLVENMPDGNAQRPGDIVTAMSGQTIEVINTDAEGRLVLADALWYTQDRFKPRFMVNLATLTGAIIVALGDHHAGLFSNDDTLARQLTDAGLATGEKLWRMPLGPEYDKIIDSKFADMRNSAGRNGGSILAAQFLQRHVNKTTWAHIDLAGTAMGAPSTEINQSWGTGYGVRLLDRLVADYYEK